MVPTHMYWIVHREQYQDRVREANQDRLARLAVTQSPAGERGRRNLTGWIDTALAWSRNVLPPAPTASECCGRMGG